MIIGTKTEFENLADYILRDYLGSEYDSYSPLNVDAFAKDYLKLDISYNFLCFCYKLNTNQRISDEFRDYLALSITRSCSDCWEEC